MLPLRRSTAPAQAGYLELLRGNADVRRLWLGTVVSLFGDWFNTLALYHVVLTLSGSELALGAVFVTKLLPLALASPLAGVLVDRLDRRRVLIGSDLLRAVVVLGFLFVRDASDLWLLYTLAATQIVISAAFLPAKNAALPSITAPRELLTANALLSATWSVMLALGAAAGGLAVDVFGTDVVFVLDSLTYLVSAFFIARMTIPQEKDEAPVGLSVVRAAARQIADGWRYLRAHPAVQRMAWAKATWAVGGGGAVLFLALIGDALFEGALATGIGVLFAARGVGTGLGPILARALFTDAQRWPLVLGACVVASGVGYLALGTMPWTAWVVVVVVLAHAASGANWVLSTTLLQQRSQDRFRGRVFATDMLLVTLIESVSILVASLLLEGGMPLRTAVLGFGAVMAASGLGWLLLVVPAERREAAA
ncbi:MAG: MFS transporter [Rubricoccaceae bacterium]|nr:MFS transporter [Rubricoccaceae bacterium]